MKTKEVVGVIETLSVISKLPPEKKPVLLKYAVGVIARRFGDVFDGFMEAKKAVLEEYGDGSQVERDNEHFHEAVEAIEKLLEQEVEIEPPMFIKLGWLAKLDELTETHISLLSTVLEVSDEDF